VKKAVRLYDRQSIGISWNEEGITRRFGHAMLFPLKLVSSAYWWIVLATALYGMFRFAKRYGVLQLVLSSPALTWLYFTLVYSLTVTGDRYGVSSIPFVAMLAAYAVMARRNQPRSTTCQPTT
jgi:hypothetical protein